MESLLGFVRLWLIVVGATTALWPEVVMGIQGIVINEFQVQGPASQYVELYDGGVGLTQLDGLALVLYSGDSEAVYSQPLVLDSIQTSPTGYCLVSFGPPLPSAHVNSSTVLISSGLNAIALYDQSGGSIIQVGFAVTDVDLVDAVVYGSSTNQQDNGLVSVLSQGQYPLQKSGNSTAGDQDTSLGRCRGWRKVMHSSFRTGSPTPGSDNDCALPLFVLNELNPTISETGAQFIEIFDGGLGFQATDGIMLVAYAANNIQGSVKVSLDLTGYMTDESGFLVVAANDTNFGDVVAPVRLRPKAFIPVSQATGIALHLGPPQRFALDKPFTSYNLIDAILYRYEDVGVINLPLLSGQAAVVDQLSPDGQDYSISRCYCCSTRNSSAFGRAPVSPGAINRNCSIANRTVLATPSNAVRINEVYIGTRGSNKGDFVEVYDGGLGLTALAGKVLVVFNGTEESGRIYRIVDLLRSATNSEGYLVIAPPSISSPADTFDDLDADWLRSGLDTHQAAGAIALYERPAASFTLGGAPTMDGLLDAVIFGIRSSLTSSKLLDSLLPGQTLPHNFLPDTALSILRCYSHRPLRQAVFAAGIPSPSAPNACAPPPCYLNELNALASSSTGIWLEIACDGMPHFPLDYVIMVLRGTRLAVARPLAGFQTNLDGFVSVNYNELGRFPGAFALALYFLPNATDLLDENKQVRLTSTGLIDALVVEKEGVQQDLTNWISVLTPGRPPVREQEAFSHRDESLSRCLVDDQWTFVLAHVSRDSTNHCPTRDNPDVVINELHLPEPEQFIELFDLGSGYTVLDDFVVVLYSAAGNALQVISLSGYTTDARGYFVLSVRDAYNIDGAYYAFAEGLIDPSSGGVALYRPEGDSFTLSVGDIVTTQGLVDAVIYTNIQGNLGALYTLMSDETSVELDSGARHFSRCFSGEYHSSSAFSGDRPPTVAAMNDCPVYPASDVIINELNFGEPSPIPLAYVELYDGGRGNTPLTYLVLVAFAAVDNNGAYRTVDLSSYHTNEQGYFVVGSHETADLVVTLERTYGPRIKPHGAGAMALYRSHPGVFYHSAPATKRSLVDAVVYTLDIEEETTLIEDLLPSGSFIIFEDESLEEEDGVDESISRCFDADRFSQSAFELTPPTPRGPNSCDPEEPAPGAGVFISEVNVKSFPEFGFVELFDGGKGNTSLDGYLLVFYQAARDRSFYEVDLMGKRTGSSGYLVIGGSGVTPTPDVIADDLSFSGRPGAVAVYQGTIDSFPRGTVATSRSLVDVVVYGDPQDRADGLIAKLVPGQIQAYENNELVSDEDVSLSRCISLSALNVAAFVSTTTTPGYPNACDVLYEDLYINEISPLGAPSERFIELYDGGLGYTSLDAIVLLLMEEGLNKLYSVIPLTGNRTNSDGYYLIHNVTELRPMGWVALYRGDYATFSAESAPVGLMVDRQTYSTHGVDTSLLEDRSSTASKEAFSRCVSCHSSQDPYLTLAPSTPNYVNQCPISDYSQRVTLTLTDASFDVWQSDYKLRPALERILAKGIDSQCQCGFTVNYLCDPKLLKGSVVYQADMYATGTDQSKRLNQSIQAFLIKTDKLTVGGKSYTVAETGDTKPASGTPAVYTIVLPVVFAAIVVIALIIVAGYFFKKRKSAPRFDDNLNLKETNAEFENPSYANDDEAEGK